MHPSKIIIGVSGPFASGKDTVAEHIESKFGFESISTSDVLRQKIRELKLEPNRENMNKYGVKFRKLYGPGFLVSEALKKAEKKRILITGLRSPAEVDILHQAGGKLIEVFSDIDTRWQRLYERGRAGDFANFEEFKELEKRESFNSNPNFPSTKEVAEKSDYLINNDSSLDELRNRTDEIIIGLLDK